MTPLRDLEQASIHVLREAHALFRRPACLWSTGKDSTVLLHLCRKAFLGRVPFPIVHLDTTYKFPDMYAFRDGLAREWGLDLLVAANREAIAAGTHPERGAFECCTALKTEALRQCLAGHSFDAVFLAIRRDEHGIRAKERVFSPRGADFTWSYADQPLEMWDLFAARAPGEGHVRVHPMLHWREVDVWRYIEAEKIPVVPLYFARLRPMVVRGETLIPVENEVGLLPGEEPRMVMCRMRSLGCTPCTGAIRSEADTVPKIIEEMLGFRRSERENRVIDHDQEGSMEIKKREGYF